MSRRISVPVLSVLLMMSLGGSLIARDSETLYTRVGFWQVPRTKWKAFGEFFEKFEKPVLDKALSSGTINRVKRGRGSDYNKAWEIYVKPVYAQLLADGTIVAYGLDTEYIHTEKPGGRISWYIISNMEADEKVEAAFDASWEKLGETDREARRALFWELLEEGSHRDDMTRIIHYAHK